MSFGKQIKIYLADGSVSGIRHGEIVNWTGQAISAPRNHVKDLKEWDESLKPGVYFLFGIDEETSESAVYIGEAENVFSRLSNHIANKDFWNEVIFFTNKDENLTKSHVKYLESRLCELAKKSNRYHLQNGNAPQAPVLPRGDRDAMEEFIENIKTLLGIMGHKVLEPIITFLENPTSNLEKNIQDPLSTLYLNARGAEASAVLTSEGIVVLAGSIANERIRDNLGERYREIREKLIEQKVLVKDGDKMKFIKDQYCCLDNEWQSTLEKQFW